MDGYCDWCEEPATHKRGEHEICDGCSDLLEERVAAEEAHHMTRRERLGWMRARNANVD